MTRIALVIVLGSLAGCSGGPDTIGDDAGGPRRGIGESCTASEDCASTLCVSVGGGHSVCTSACTVDRECPGAGWACVQPDRFDATICGCESSGAEICGDGIDNDCNALVDDCRMCGGIPVGNDDHANCGSCGHACRVDQECHAGACRCTNASAMDCGGACIDVSISSVHCGSCTNACLTGQTCSHGTCACPTGQMACGGACISVQDNSLHCGSCDNACNEEQVCASGVCTCPAGGTLCGAHCVDRTTSVTDCGACGHACRADQSCRGGACACGTGQMDCGGTCIPTTNDPMNCGGCGNACAPGETCSASACHCASGLHCGGACVASSDTSNCGVCGRVCPGTEICSAGACRCASSTQSYCASGDQCVTLTSDPNNCGACDHVCDPATTCTGSSCVCPTTGQTLCAGAGCVSLSTDPTHCGACTTACAPNQICSVSRCSCPTALPYLCPTVGCVSEATDPNNCGSCGHACRTGEICSSFACACPVGTQRWCAAQGTCIDVAADPNNCGACGNVCPSAATCSGSACHCPIAGQTACGTSCVDLTNDLLHCGSCARSCTGSQICSASACTCNPPVVTTERRLTTVAGASDAPSLAWNGTNGLVAWMDRRSPSPGFYTLLLNADGTAAGTERFVASTTVPAFVSVASNGVGFAVAMITSSSSTLTVQAIAADGTLQPATSTYTADVSYDMRISFAPGVGYFVVSTGFNVDFTALGAIGSPPSPSIHLRPGNGDQLATAITPTGQIGVLASPGSFSPMYLHIVNADGSVTLGATSVPIGGGTFTPRQPSLLWDGTTWIATWFAANGTTNEIGIARGPALATQSIVVQSAGNGTTNLMRRPLLARGNGDVVVLWESRARSTDTVWNIVGERFTFPATSTGGATALEPTPDVYLVATSVADGALTGAVTSSGLLLSWSDTRWGATEIYDELVTLPACGM